MQIRSKLRGGRVIGAQSESLESRRLLSVASGLFPVQQIATGMGNYPSGLIAADFTGDGKTDLITLATQTAVTFQRGIGGGNFANVATFSLPSSVSHGQAADLNGDGKLDLLLYSSSSNQLFVLFSDGSANFKQPVTVQPTPPAGNIALADVDKDGDLDIVAQGIDYSTSTAKNLLTVLRNDGTGSFSQSNSSTIPLSCQLSTAGDFDGDGDADIVLGTSNTSGDNLYLMKNDGMGTFASPTAFQTGHTTSLLVAMDVDGDHDLDLVSGGGNPASLQLLLNNGAGRFTAGTLFANIVSVTGLRTADIDSDGNTDVVAFNSEGVQVLHNSGSGSFVLNGLLRVAESPYDCVVADFSGDNRPDLLLSNGNNATLSYVINDGSGSFLTPKTLPQSTSAFDVASADLNGDGLADLVTANFTTAGSVLVQLNTGGGNFDAGTSYSTGAGTWRVILKDLDNDGDVDIATANYSSPTSISVLLNKGNGTFGSAQTISTPDLPYDIESADINKDGYADLVVSYNSLDAIQVLLNNRAGQFSLSGATLPAGDGPERFALADLNADGAIDAVVPNYYGGGVSILMNTGGTLTKTTTLFIGSNTGPSDVVAFDVDGDKDLDFAVLNRLTSNVLLYRNNGSGSFSKGDSYSTYYYYPTRLIAADMDNDGDLDLLATSDAHDGVAVLENYNQGTFAAPALYAAIGSISNIAAADLDGDYDTDVICVCSHSNGRSLALLTNNSPPTIAKLVNGVLTITAANSRIDDTFYLSQNSGVLTVSASAGTLSFPSVSVSSITFQGTSRADNLSLSTTISQPLSYIGGGGADTLGVNGGVLTATTDLGTSAANLSLFVSLGASVKFNVSQHLASLAVNGQASIASNGNLFLDVQDLSVGIAGTLDVANNALIVDYASSSPGLILRNKLIAGRNGGAWNGSDGIISSAVAGTAGSTLGYGEASSVLSSSGGTFFGQKVDGTALLIRFTYLGDANLDGKVDVVDLGIVSGNWQRSEMSFNQGDFNYDGLVDVVDLGALSSNWQKTIVLPITTTVKIATPVKVVPVKKTAV